MRCCHHHGAQVPCALWAEYAKPHLNQTVNLRPKITTNDNQTNTKSGQNMLRETKDGKSIQAQFNS